MEDSFTTHASVVSVEPWCPLTSPSFDFDEPATINPLSAVLMMAFAISSFDPPKHFCQIIEGANCWAETETVLRQEIRNKNRKNVFIPGFKRKLFKYWTHITSNKDIFSIVLLFNQTYIPY